MNLRFGAVSLTVLMLSIFGCGKTAPPLPPSVSVDRSLLTMFAPLPEVMASVENPSSAAKIELGRRLYFATDLSADNDLSCNSCHDLAKYGTDTGPVSLGHTGQRGTRNAPTVYNAAGHVAQFWDGRDVDVENQALGPILNPIEMAMTDSKAVITALRADSSYVKAFSDAFPGDQDPLTFDNLGRAIGAFERGLVTPSRWDRFLTGDDRALSDAEKNGLKEFLAAGCPTCHAGPYLGGAMFMKAGLLVPWPDTSDAGRMTVTKQEADRMVFKVPSLRNIEMTGPYFHNGTVSSLEKAVEMMAYHQLNKRLTPEQTTSIVAWLRTLTGERPTAYVTPTALR